MALRQGRYATTLVVLALATWVQAGPRTKDRPSGPATLPAVRAEIVRLDAVVTAKDGLPVDDLVATDFEVLEDGKAQTPSYFAVVRRPKPLAEPAPTGTQDALPAGPPAAMVDPNRKRRFVLVVDDLSTAPGNMADARKAMRLFVDRQRSEDDAVAITTTSGAGGVLQDFTQDRETLKRAIERVTSRYQPVEPSGTPYLSEYQAELIDRGDVEALNMAVREVLQTEDHLGEIGAREKAYTQARRMAFEIMERSGRTLQAIESIVRGLAPLPGRKIVVLVSDGFLVGLGAAENRAYDVRRIIDAATRAGVVLYALDTRGLIADVPGGGAAFQGPGVLTAPGGRASLQTRGNEAQRQSLNALAEDTGGFLVRNTNDLSAGFERILRDNDVFYLLAYEPSRTGRPGDFHRIEVRIPTRAGLRVRTRSGYFVTSERGSAAPGTADSEALREREMTQALSSLFPLDGVPLHVRADFVDLPPQGSQAVIRAHVDLSRVPFREVGDRFETDIEIAGAVYDISGQLVGDVAGERAQLNLNASRYREVVSEGLRLQRTVPLRPGRYQVRMAAREATRSLLGSTSVSLEIPDIATRPLTLSDIFLLADDGPGAAELLDVQVDPRLRRGQGLHYVVYAYGSAAAQASLQAQIWRAGRLVGVTPKHTLTANSATGRAKWSERISLEAFEPDAYELRVRVSARDGEAKAERRAAFQVQ
jgi:VWFA-related protein